MEGSEQLSRGFKRPMVHYPEAAAAASRVKTRSQVLMEELGLSAAGGSESSGRGQADSSSSDEEEEEPSSQWLPAAAAVGQSVDQRHQLTVTLQETRRKLRSAQASLMESEQERDRRMKLMRKTHKTTMANKQHLIEDLQDIIVDRDRFIRQLEGGGAEGVVNNKSSSSCDPLHQLVQRISLLHSENSSLTGQYEEAMDRLQHALRDKERLEDELVVYRETPLTPLHKSHMAQQFNKLQARLEEMEEDQTATQLTRDLQQQVESLTATVQSLTSVRDELLVQTHQIKPLSSEVSRLERELSQQQVAISRVRTQLVEAEGSNKQLLLRVRYLEDQLVKEHSAHSNLQQHYTSSQQLVQQLQLAAAAAQEEASSECSEEQYHHLVEECTRLRQQCTADHTHYTGLLAEVRGLRDGLVSTRSVMEAVSELMRETIAITTHEVCQRIMATSQYNSQLVTQHREEVRERRRLHNQLVELRGNIRVMCRVRPAIAEDGQNPEVMVRSDPIDEGVVSVYSKGSWKQFDVDQVFGSTSSQQQVFSHVEDLVVSCLDGYHVCIFAYGQTGSGKTHTMEGPPSDPGINQLALTKLFSLVEERGSEWSYSMIVSVIEVYNETVRDLLSSSTHQRLDIKQRPTGVYVPGLTEVQVTNMAEVQQLFDLGRSNRATGATLMNIHSSRSHALLCVTVTGHCSSLGVTTHGRLNLIDLAGSERLTKSGSDGVRQQEACHINKSLSALGDVIHSLRSRAQHIPYRNSRLTYLLQDSLGGDSKTLMVVCVSPVSNNVPETVCSLNFAQRVKTVELGQASRRVAEDTAISRIRADTVSNSRYCSSRGGRQAA